MKRTKWKWSVLIPLLALWTAPPPAGAANDFTTDANVVAVYDASSWGTIGTDIINAQNMTLPLGPDTSVYSEGDASFTFHSANKGHSHAEWSDTSLPANFPGKNGTTNRTFSFFFRFRCTSLNPSFSATAVIKKGWMVGCDAGYLGTPFRFSPNNSSWAIHASAIQTDRWYGVGMSYNASDGAYRVRVWDYTANSLLGIDKTGSLAANLTTIGTNPLHLSDENEYDLPGWIDDFAVFADVLSTDEIDSCRAGTYDYSADPNCCTHWSFDSSNAQTEDIGAITPSVWNSPEYDSSTYKTAPGALLVKQFDYSDMYRNDADWPADTPLKNGTSNGEFSWCFWHRPTWLPDGDPKENTYIVAKGNVWYFGLSYETATSHKHFRISSYCGSTWYYYTLTDLQLQTNRWYHIGVTQSAASDTYHLRIWDDTGSTVYDITGATSGDNNVDAYPWRLGGRWNGWEGGSGVNGAKGYYDEMVFFNDILTSDEIDKIRGGKYGVGPSPRDMWWWRRRHSN